MKEKRKEIKKLTPKAKEKGLDTDQWAKGKDKQKGWGEDGGKEGGKERGSDIG